jgi:uncharacterized membrane protein
MSEYLNTGAGPLNTGAGQERAIAKLLHYGTALASLAIAAGLVVQWLSPLAKVTFGLGGGDLMKIGVALFIVLPVSRVALMLIQFVQARDTAYMAISALVLAIIGAGFLAGL